MKILLKNARSYSGTGFAQSHVLIDAGRIVSVSPAGDAADVSCSGCRVFDLQNALLVPGFADVHVHLREPGFFYKETVKTGTAAAAAGGYTAVCAMPNLDPVPDCLENLQVELDAIARDACVQVYPYGAITCGEKGEMLADMEAMAPYVAAFSDDGKGVQSREMMERAMVQAKALGKCIAAHCEDNTLLHGGCIHDGRWAKAHNFTGICSESEWGPVARDLELVAKTGCQYHVCHVSTKESVELIRQAKRGGLPVTCETAPHYLVLCEDDLQDEGRFKMNPPLRAREDREALRQGMLDGTIDVIATDHAPHTAEEKAKGLRGSAMGIVGLETAFPVLYTALVQPSIVPLERLIEAMAVRPREIFGLPGGEIAPGMPADLTVLDLHAEGIVDPSRFRTMGRATPFDKMAVSGAVEMTICGGRVVYEREENK